MHETGSGGDRSAVFVAPPVEEFAKGSVILLLALVRRKEFDGIIDGLVYAGMVGVGFAFTENILYYGRIFRQLSEEVGSDEGLRGAFVLFVIRGLISPFAHPLFTSFTAIGIGIAVRHRSTIVRFLAPVVGYPGRGARARAVERRRELGRWRRLHHRLPLPDGADLHRDGRLRAGDAITRGTDDRVAALRLRAVRLAGRRRTCR